ncbi:BTAD domain-containing putative transcriptional regulator [Kitasatospora sp. NPDC008050]|uniref:AfsR/SARP family transcriptional regulator n=1 Tax=Kitasatospora sp. NPDC008050 TaxID=3364021 RepID=UPI0036E3FF12
MQGARSALVSTESAAAGGARRPAAGRSTWQRAARQDTAELRFTLLGPLRGWVGEAELDLGRPQQQEVLAMLLTAAGRTVSVELLAEGVWGGRDWPGNPVQVLRTHVYRLRALLKQHAADSCLVTVGDGYALRLAPDALDTAAFELALPQAAQARHDGAPPGEVRAVLTAALDLWTAEPLTGLAGPHAEAVRLALTERRLTLLEAKLELDAELGDRPGLAAEVGDLVLEQPERQRLRAVQMLALYRAGRTAEALAVYEDVRRSLAGVTPDRALCELQARILRADPALSPAQAQAAPAERPRPAGLPPRITDFTGRQAELDRLTGVLAAGEPTAPEPTAPEPTEPGSVPPGSAASDPATPGPAALNPTVVISAIDGIGGVGKTALAVQTAHHLLDRFPDGQLYADLRGADRAPAEPVAVLTGFLRALGLDDAAITGDLAERAALYRSALAGSQVLVVLDNAATAEQVAPLLPGSPGCAVLITSRGRLGGLAGAHHLRLDVLAEEEAVALFARIVGAARTAAEPVQLAAVVAACGHLPLAIRIAASRLAARPDWTLATLADRLADEQHRLAELCTGDIAVEATFALSYAGLSTDQARAFRLLSLPETPDLNLACAAALLGLEPEAAEDLLESLVDLNLLESRAFERYRFHDLVRVYARGRCAEEESASATRQALARLLAFCQATARHAEATAHAVEQDRCDLVEVEPGAAGQQFESAQQAMDWMRTEAAVHRALVERCCADPELPLVRAASLIDKMGAVLFDRTYMDTVAELAARTAAVAAERGDQRCQALARYVRGNLLWHTSDFVAAEAELTAAVALCADGSAPRLRACALLALGSNARVYGRFPEAVAYCEESIELFRELRDAHSEGGALGELAFNYAKLGRCAEARAAAERGVELSGDTESMGRATSWYSLARVLRMCGEPDAALAGAERALPLFRSLGVPAFEAATGNLIAQVHVETGRHEQAVHAAESALPLARRTSEMLAAGLLRSLGHSLGRLAQPARARACLSEAVRLFEGLGVSAEAAEAQALLAELGQQGPPESRS